MQSSIDEAINQNLLERIGGELATRGYIVEYGVGNCTELGIKAWQISERKRGFLGLPGPKTHPQLLDIGILNLLKGHDSEPAHWYLDLRGQAGQTYAKELLGIVQELSKQYGATFIQP